MSVVESLDLNVRARTEGFAAKMSSASRAITKTGAAAKEASAAAGGFGAAMSGLGKMAGAVAIGNLISGAITKIISGIRDAIASFIDLGKQEAQAIDHQSKLSDQLGITTEAFSGIDLASRKAGVDTDTLANSMKKMTRNVVDAAQGSGAAKDAISALGLSAEQLAKQTPDQQLHTLLGALEQVPNQSQKAQLAFDIFGKQGVSLLSLTTDALDKANADAEMFGLTFSRIDGAKVEEMNDDISDLQDMFKGLARQFVVLIAPSITAIIERVKAWVASMGGVKGVAQLIMEWLGAAFDFVLDAFDNMVIGWHRVQQFINSGIKLLVDGFYYLALGVDKFMQAIGKDSNMAAVLENFSENLTIDNQRRDQLVKDINADPTKNKIRRFFKAVNDDAEKRAKETADNIKGGFGDLIDLEDDKKKTDKTPKAGALLANTQAALTAILEANNAGKDAEQKKMELAAQNERVRQRVALEKLVDLGKQPNDVQVNAVSL